MGSSMQLLAAECWRTKGERSGDGCKEAEDGELESVGKSELGIPQPNCIVFESPRSPLSEEDWRL